MQRKWMIGVVTLMLLASIGGVAYAQSGTLKEYTGYQVMNLGVCSGCAARLLVDYYNSAGVRVLTRTDSIPPGGIKNIQQKTDDLQLAPGVYSAVVISDQPIASVVGEIDSDPTVTSAIYYAPFSNYTGGASGSLTVTLPELMKNWYGLDSRVRLQNSGSDTANVTIQYYAGMAGASSIPPLTRTIARHAAITLDQSTQPGLEAPSGTFQGRFLGSAIITSDQPLIAVVDQTDPTNRLKFTYNGFGSDDAGVELFAPAIYAKWYNTLTSLAIANPSTTATVNVQIEYRAGLGSLLADGRNGEGSARLVNLTLAPGKASTRYEGSSDGDLYNSYQRFSGTARIISTGGPVVAKVNQTQATWSNGQNSSGAYNSVRVDRLTPTVAVPLIQADYYSYYTSLQCANVSRTQSAQVNFRYTSDSSSAMPAVTATIQHTIPAGGNIIIYEKDRDGASADINKTGSPWWNGSLGTTRFNGSTFVTAVTPGVNIICVVNEVGGSVKFDNMNTFNGVAAVNAP